MTKISRRPTDIELFLRDIRTHFLSSLVKLQDEAIENPVASVTILNKARSAFEQAIIHGQNKALRRLYIRIEANERTGSSRGD